MNPAWWSGTVQVECHSDAAVGWWESSPSFAALHFCVIGPSPWVLAQCTVYMHLPATPTVYGRVALCILLPYAYRITSVICDYVQGAIYRQIQENIALRGWIPPAWSGETPPIRIYVLHFRRLHISFHGSSHDTGKEQLGGKYGDTVIDKEKEEKNHPRRWSSALVFFSFVLEHTISWRRTLLEKPAA